MRMDELAEPAIEVVRDGRVRIHPEGQRRRYLDWMENIRPWCISRQLWWGHRIPVWYRGEDDLRAGSSRPRATAGSATPTCSTPGSRPACGRSRRSAGPSDTPELRAFYPTDVLSTARDIIFLWVARMVMIGLEFTGDIPFDRRLRPLDHPGARRAADVEVARHRHRPARPDRRRPAPAGLRARAATSPPTAPTPSASACWRCPRRRTCASTRRRSPRGASSPTSSGTRRGSCCCACPRMRAGAAPRAATVEDRWILSRLQARQGGRRAGDRRFEFHRAALGLYDFVYGELCDWYLELVKPRLYADDNAEVAAVALHVLARDARARAPGDPVRDRGDLVATCPGARRPADGAPLAGRPTTRCATRTPRPRSRARSPPCRRCAAGATASARRRARASRRGSSADGYERTRRRTSRGSRASSGGERRRAGRDRRASPAAASRCWRPTRSTPRPRRSARGRARRRLEAEIERAEGKLANQGFVAKAPAGGRPGRARQARRGCRRSWRRSGDAGRSSRPRTTCSRLELFGMRFGLERMRRLLTALGSPQQRVRARSTSSAPTASPRPCA